MGREAQVLCRIGGETETLRAQLESRELILRGERLKRRLALDGLTELAVQGPALLFRSGGELVRLELGDIEAAKWLDKIRKPPPSLASKLGISAELPALVLGPVQQDPSLAAALAGASTQQGQDAAVLLALVRSLAELEQALAVHAELPCRGLWVVHEKGPKAALGDTAIRQHLRGKGYRDNKTSAVSERLTATRYLRPQA